MATAPIGQIEVVDPATVMLRGYATITGVPFRYLDPFPNPFDPTLRIMQFDPGAFSSWLARNDGAPVDVHWQHGVENFQIAETVELAEDPTGLAFLARPMATSVAIDALTAMAGRARTGASLMLHFGETELRAGVEHIVDVPEVGEIGPAPKGANPYAYTEIIDIDAQEVSDPAPTPAADNNTAALQAAVLYRAVAHLSRRS